MKFPSFDDFLSTLTEEKMMELSEGIDAKTEGIKLNPKVVNNIDVSPLMAASALFNIRILRAYHEWLSEELSGL